MITIIEETHFGFKSFTKTEKFFVPDSSNIKDLYFQYDKIPENKIEIKVISENSVLMNIGMSPREFVFTPGLKMPIATEINGILRKTKSIWVIITVNVSDLPANENEFTLLYNKIE